MNQVFHKRASWLELFYDVAFIALVAQLTYLAAAHHHTLIDILNIFIVGYSIFVAWWATTANRNLQTYESPVDKLWVQSIMIGVFFMSLTMPAVFEGSYLGYFLTLAGVRLLQAGSVVRMYYFHPDSRPKTYNILQGFLVASALWGASALVGDPYHFVLAFMALAIDILIPLTTGKGNTKRYLNVHHMHERLGLFLMLVIGESMIVVALSNTAQILTFEQLITVFSGVGMMVALWWLYFAHNDKFQEVRPMNLFTYLHAHALLYLSIVCVSVAYKLQLGGGEPAAVTVFSIVGSVGISVALLGIRLNLHQLCLRAIFLSIGLFILTLGTSYGVIHASPALVMVVITGFFLLVALLDHYNAFGNKSSLTQSQQRDPVN